MRLARSASRLEVALEGSLRPDGRVRPLFIMSGSIPITAPIENKLSGLKCRPL